MSTTTTDSGMRASLPQEWKLVELGELCEHNLGKMLDRQKNEGVPRPYLRNPNVKWFGFDLTDVKEMPIKDSEREKYSVRPGDVIVCEGGEAGRAAIWNGEADEMYIQKALHRVRVGPELHNRFLVYVLMVDAKSGHLNSYFTGTTIPHFTGQDLHRYKIPLPPLSEQKRIADILDKADAIRRKRREAVAFLSSARSAMFHDRFGDPITNPKSWGVVELRDLFATSPNYGTMIKPSDDVGGWLDLRVANIQDGNLDLSNRKYVDLPEEMIERHEVRDGDLLLARAIGSIEHLGKCIIAHPNGQKWAFDSHLMRIRFDTNRVLPRYVHAFLESPGGRHEFLRNSRRSAVQFNINTKEMACIRIPLPPIEEQLRYMAELELMDQLANSQQTASAANESLFNSLAQRAFKGEL